MSGEERPRIPLARAQFVADLIVELIGAWCDRIMVAGSIRRGKPEVGDVEIVAIPRRETRDVQVDMFTRRLVEIDLLQERCDELLGEGLFVPRLDKNHRAALGSKYKRLLFDDVPLDLFITSEECWGTILLLRTGPQEFNQRLVLKRSEGGWLTRGYFFRDGRLWKLPPPYDADLAPHATPVPTPQEGDVFRALGYQFVPPERRGSERPPMLAEATA